MKIKESKLSDFIASLSNINTLQVKAVKLDTTIGDSAFKNTLNQVKGINFANKSGNINKNSMENFDITELTREEIDFFKLCAEKDNLVIGNIAPTAMQVNFEIPQEGEEPISYKTVNFSKGLFNLIDYAHKTQKPVRLDFQGNSSVILKINTEGKLTAEFISNDAAMEYAIKSSLPGLRQKLDSDGIPYQDIYYRDKNKNKQNNKGGNK